MASVKLTNVKKIYDNEVVAVHEFNLDIKDKEFIVFVGPSGCGKSTTLRMIAGLEEISEGTVEIDGEVVNDLDAKDRNIAMVFQNYALYPHLTVYENMAFNLKLKKMPKEEIDRRVKEAAEVLGITEYLLRKPSALSGGQRQRVAIGRAMVRDSKVFLMDEPLSNLDAKLRNQMRAEIIMLRKKIDTTFIYVTHDQTEAMTLGDRIVVMKDGFIQQVGTPTEVFEMPDNLFVAEFIGAPKMNVLQSELVFEGGKYFVSPFGKKVEIGGHKGAELLKRNVAEGPIYLGIRPEHFVLTDENNPLAIPCTVLINEMMGSEVHLHVSVDGTDETLIVRIPTVDLSLTEQGMLEPGAKICVAFDGQNAHLFAADTRINLLTDSKNVPINEVVKDEVSAAAPTENDAPSEPKTPFFKKLLSKKQKD